MSMMFLLSCVLYLSYRGSPLCGFASILHYKNSVNTWILQDILHLITVYTSHVLWLLFWLDCPATLTVTQTPFATWIYFQYISSSFPLTPISSFPNSWPEGNVTLTNPWSWQYEMSVLHLVLADSDPNGKSRFFFSSLESPVSIPESPWSPHPGDILSLFLLFTVGFVRGRQNLVSGGSGL